VAVGGAVEKHYPFAAEDGPAVALCLGLTHPTQAVEVLAAAAFTIQALVVDLDGAVVVLWQRRYFREKLRWEIYHLR